MLTCLIIYTLSLLVKFLKKNIILLAGLGGGILVLIIIVLVITCDTKRRSKTNRHNSDLKTLFAIIMK